MRRDKCRPYPHAFCTEHKRCLNRFFIGNTASEHHRQIHFTHKFRQYIKTANFFHRQGSAFIYNLWHKFERLMREYPEIELELVSNHRFVNIVAEGFDAGIRLGRDVAKDMIAQRIAPDMQMCVVASPDYWAKHGTPNMPNELTSHRCLRFRLPSTGGIMAWEFVQTDRTESPSSQKFLPQGGFVATSSTFLHHAAKQGAGVICTPKDSVQTDLDKGILQEVLANYAVSYEGYHLYYPNNRQNSPIFRALVACLKED